VIIGLRYRSHECTPSWTSDDEEEYTRNIGGDVRRCGASPNIGIGIGGGNVVSVGGSDAVGVGGVVAHVLLVDIGGPCVDVGVPCVGVGTPLVDVGVAAVGIPVGIVV